MGISQAKERLTRDEIEQIIDCNTRLFKNDPKFSSYIVKLLTYLMENHYYESAKRNTSTSFSSVGSGLGSKFLSSAIVSDSWDLDSHEFCAGCGSTLEGSRKCSRCGQIAF